MINEKLYKTINSTNQTKFKIEKFLKSLENIEKDYNSINVLGQNILSLSGELNIDIPINYSQLITKLTIQIQKIQTLKGNIILNNITVERMYWNYYYQTLHQYKEENKTIGTLHEWKAAFDLTNEEILKYNIFDYLEKWKSYIKIIEDLVQSTLEIVNSGKKTLTVLMDRKW